MGQGRSRWKISASSTGAAFSSEEAYSNTGISGAGDTRISSVKNTGDATAIGGGVANTGIIGALTIVQQPKPLTWPIIVGRIPPRASAFQMRPEVIKRIEALFLKRSDETSLRLSTPSGVVLVGHSGVGKTQIAAWCVSQALQKNTDLVVWVDASILDALPTAFAQAASRLELPGANAIDSDMIKDAELFVEWLQSTNCQWLVVFDNIVHPMEAAKWWPISQLGNGVVLATSQDRDLLLTSAGRTSVDVDVFDDLQSLDYLKQRFKGVGKEHLLDDELDDLVDELGRLPLALSHAAAHMITNGICLSGYLRELRSAGTKLDTLMSGNPDQYASSEITKTLLLTLERTASTTPKLRKALAVVSVLGAGGHPFSWWTMQAATPLREEKEKTLHPAIIKYLEKLSLISISDENDPIVRIHSLVARSLREQMSLKETQDALILASSVLLEVWSRRDYEEIDEEPLRNNATALLAHSKQCDDFLWKVGRGGSLSYFCVKSLLRSGFYSIALTNAEDAAREAARIFGEGHPDTVRAQATLIEALFSSGKLSEAVSYGEGCVGRALDSLGPEHPETLEAQNNLMIAYRRWGQIAKSVNLGERVVTGRSHVLGDLHPKTLQSKNNLGVAYWNAGDLAKAISLHKGVVENRRTLLGNQHHSTLESLSNLAVAYWQAGDIQKAIEVGEEAAKGRIRLWGSDHPRTLEALHNLVSFYRDSGRFKEALRLAEYVVQKYTERLGSKHPRTVNSQHVLSVCYRKSGQLPKAISEAKTVIAASTEIQGADHSYTLAARCNLAACYGELGYPVAVDLAKDVFQSYNEVLGCEHPNTLRAGLVYIVCCRQLGEEKVIESLGADLLEKCIRVLGNDHPHTRAVQQELASCSARRLRPECDF